MLLLLLLLLAFVLAVLAFQGCWYDS